VIEVALEIKWEDLVGPSESALSTAGTTGTSIGAAQLEITDSDLIQAASQTARDYAHDRAAELVGMQWRNGKLVPNPNADWRIDETTRNEIRTLVEKAFCQETRVEDLVQSIQNAGAFRESRAKTIARTEIARAQSLGTMDVWKSLGSVRTSRWDTSANPGVCDICEENASAGAVELGTEFPSGDIAPPAHPNCVVSGTVVSASDRVSKYFKRWFDGEVVDITCLDGTQLSITPNHPVLTSAGWVAAGQLQQGLDLLYYTNPGRLATDYPGAHLMPTVIEEVPSSLLKTGSVATMSVPASAEDFHGDASLNSEIDIVYVDGLLQDKVESGLAQFRGASPLVNTGASVGLHAASSKPQFFNARLGSESSLMRSSGDRLSVRRSQLFEENTVGSTVVSNFQARLDKGLSDTRTVDTDAVCNINRGFTCDIGGVQLSNVIAAQPGGLSSIPSQQLLSLASHAKTGIPELAADSVPVKSDSPAQISNRLTGKIGAVQIAHVERRRFSGLVHNLETGSGYYFANGLIVHNCRCALVAEDIDSGDEE
jgi:hypothetical protein